MSSDSRKPVQPTKVPRIRSLSIDEDDDSSPVVSLMNVLSGAKINPKEAELNASSISDGKGGRIELELDDKNIKKM